MFTASAILTIFYAAHAGSFDIIPRQGIAIVIWGMLASGFALGILPRATVPKRLGIPLAGAAALALLTLLSITWTASDQASFGEFARVMHYAGLALLIVVALDRHTWTAAIGGICAGATLIAFAALASRLFPDAIGHSAVGEAFDPSRLEYPLGYWNALGAWCAMTAAAVLVWSAHAERLLSRVVSLAAVPAILATEYLTYSRGGAIGVAVGVALAIALSRIRWAVAIHAIVAAAATTIVILAVRSNEQIAEATGGDGGGTVLAVLLAVSLACGLTAYVTGALAIDRLRMPSSYARNLVKGVAIVLLIATAAVGRPFADEAWERFSGDTEGKTGAQTADRLGSLGSERDEVYEVALDAFKEDPLKGLGAGSFEFWWAANGSGSTLEDAHSLYIEQLAELGLPGLLATLVFVGGLAGVGLWARSRADTDRRAGAAAAALAAFGVYLVVAGIDWYWELTAVSAVAIGLASCTMLGLAGASSSRRSRRLAMPARVALTAAALACLAIQVPGYLSTLWIRESQDAIEVSDLRRAADLAERAESIEPWATDPLIQQSLIAEHRGRHRQAIDLIQRAIEREPFDWHHQFQLSRLHEVSGDPDRALETARAAKRLSPKTPLVRSLLAELKIRLGG